MSDVRIVCRYSQETAFVNRLQALGLIVRPRGQGVDEVADERWIEDTTSPVLSDINGDHYVNFECTASQADKLPPENNPAFALVWRSDVFDEETGELLPRPEAEVERDSTGDGVPDTTVMQPVGVII